MPARPVCIAAAVLSAALSSSAWAACPPGTFELAGVCVPRPGANAVGGPSADAGREPGIGAPTPPPPTATREPIGGGWTSPGSAGAGSAADAGYGSAIGGVVGPGPAPGNAGWGGGAPTSARQRPPSGAAGAIIGAPLRPVRAFVSAAQIPPAGVGGYGIVALTAKPTDASRGRLQRVCRQFVASLVRNDSLPSSIPLASRMITLWPVEEPDSPLARADNCTFLTERYDLFGGASAIQDARRQGAALTGRGPFLLGWSPSASRGRPDRLVLVYDLSAYDSDDSFERAFAFWQQKIIEDPGRWRNGWSWEAIRLSVRDFFDSYAEAALKAISIAGGGS